MQGNKHHPYAETLSRFVSVFITAASKLNLDTQLLGTLEENVYDETINDILCAAANKMREYTSEVPNDIPDVIAFLAYHTYCSTLYAVSSILSESCVRTFNYASTLMTLSPSESAVITKMEWPERPRTEPGENGEPASSRGDFDIYNISKLLANSVTLFKEVLDKTYEEEGPTSEGSEKLSCKAAQDTMYAFTLYLAGSLGAFTELFITSVYKKVIGMATNESGVGGTTRDDKYLAQVFWRGSAALFPLADLLAERVCSIIIRHAAAKRGVEDVAIDPSEISPTTTNEKKEV